jgi:hypothetical protein
MLNEVLSQFGHNPFGSTLLVEVGNY